jgi:hypothetical protein
MTDEYRAPQPRAEWRNYAKYAMGFPLLWDGLKFIVNAIVGKSLGNSFLPEQSKEKIDFDQAKAKIPDGLILNDINVITYDGAKLETYEIKQNNNPNNTPYVVNFLTSPMDENIVEEMVNEAQEINGNVVGFTFRGLGRDKKDQRPRSRDDLITDGIAQVERLLAPRLIRAENIYLKGDHLGADIAIEVARHFHRQGYRVNLFASCASSSQTNILVGKIRTHGTGTGYKESLGWKLLGWLAKPFIKIGLSLAKWEINADDAYKEIPQECKDYIVQRSTKEARNSKNPAVVDDLAVPHYASLHEALKCERKEWKEESDSIVTRMERLRNHTESVALPCVDKGIKGFIEGRDKLKEHKMSTEHNGPSLQNNVSDNPATFFRKFVETAQNEHRLLWTMKS